MNNSYHRHYSPDEVLPPIRIAALIALAPEHERVALINALDPSIRDEVRELVVPADTLQTREASDTFEWKPVRLPGLSRG